MSYVWAQYTSDDGLVYAVKVDAAYYAMPERGWLELAAPGDTQYPRGWRLRRVRGITEEGDFVFADCAHVDADLWTGAVSGFTFIRADGAHALAVAIERQRERRLLIPSAAPGR